ncbi:type IX secretion system outer membrane channel protein PorV [Bergeyella cardium]|uniref:Type IX secretion system outer membrane channel protein PorV n=1 Tax=Bergeyella cardium TaxID=1585976 RepID=A0A6P1QVF4_9FLAO|nr:type IX secretion system outer membrane channel protein PorV [Bergeyella cardium]QHN65745.1 type IX secretion system outer membrane channel protein PorV [Bergeyella cardium]WHE33335.1 type IX secretion system outer membrane channel protein PorV [Bergeyella cardium]
MNLKSKLFVGLGLGLSLSAAAQEVKPVLTGAPFLRITPDARAAGMGDQGVATSTDAFSQFWNAAKYPFSKTTSAVAVNYTPYLSKLTSDVFLLYASYHQFLGQEERSTISASINYFNMGEVELNQLSGTQIVTTGKVKPNEFSVDVAYGLKLSDVYSMAVTGRYIRSDFGTFGDNSTIKPANTFAVDVSGFYQSEKHSSFGDYEGTARAGWAIQNLGPKLDYSGDENSRSYLPTTLRLGAGYDLYLDDMNKVGLSLEASKLLVPGSQLNNSDPANPKYEVPNVGVVEGIGKSFSNKKSVMLSGAVEYSYDDAFAVRGGYFHESDEQGGRRFATVGVGFKYQSFNTSKTNTALDNTLRFGLTWNIGGESSNANN